MLNVQIAGKSSVTGGVSQHGQRSASDHDASDGQTVKAVGQVHGVGRPHHHNRNEKQKWDESNQVKIRRTQETFQYQAGSKLFEKWKDQVGLLLPRSAQPDQCQADPETQAELQDELHPSGQTQASPLDDLDVVISKTDGAKSDD